MGTDLRIFQTDQKITEFWFIKLNIPTLHRNPVPMKFFENSSVYGDSDRMKLNVDRCLRSKAIGCKNNIVKGLSHCQLFFY